MDEINPYAPPETTELDEGRQFDQDNVAWRDGKLLMVRKDAELPDRCIKCNQPAEGFRFRRSLTWANPSIFIFILCGLLPFILFYVLLSKRGRVTVGMCPEHQRKRKRAIKRGWLFALAGLSLFGVAAFLPDNVVGIVVISGFGLMVTGLIVGAYGSRVLIPARIDKNFIWLAKVSPVYLATFPDSQVR